MKIVELPKELIEKLETLRLNAEDFHKRYVAAARERDNLLLEFARTQAKVDATLASNDSYRLDDSGRFLVLGQGGEWKRL